MNIKCAICRKLVPSDQEHYHCIVCQSDEVLTDVYGHYDSFLGAYTCADNLNLLPALYREKWLVDLIKSEGSETSAWIIAPEEVLVGLELGPVIEFENIKIYTNVANSLILDKDVCQLIVA